MKTLLSFTLIFLTASFCAAPSARAQVAQGWMGMQVVQLTGDCTTEIAPDKAFIVGGVSSSAVEPEDAVAQLDKQIAAIRAYVDEGHGHLELLERVRTLKNPSQQPNRQDNEPPFEVVQRLQADFPANAPVDAILQKFVELGLDRFGDNMINKFDQRREAVIRFRISDFDAKMQAFQDSCAAEAWARWCKTAEASECPSPKPPAALEMIQFTVRSQESLLRPDGGGSVPWQFSFGRAQRAQQPQDLLGNMKVHLDGNILLNYRLQPKDAPPDDKQ
ncbi:MAG TPA: SIMPL domain-containing protein [Candidatus Acidoferrales bacterium]|nr:SIMPL domain-containing protein [Candidatus Acidoferrales bacterium]